MRYSWGDERRKDFVAGWGGKGERTNLWVAHGAKRTLSSKGGVGCAFLGMVGCLLIAK